MAYNKYKKYKKKYKDQISFIQSGNAGYIFPKQDPIYSLCGLTGNNIQTGLIIGHGVQIDDELCVVPDNICYKPGSSSFSPGILGLSIDDDSDLLISKNFRYQAEFREGYKGIYQPGSLIPNLRIIFPADWSDDSRGLYAYSGIITQSLPDNISGDHNSPFIKTSFTQEQISYTSTERNIKEKWENFLEKNLSLKLYRNKNRQLLVETELANLIDARKISLIQWKLAIKDECMKYNNEIIFDNDELYKYQTQINGMTLPGIRLSEILEKISLLIKQGESIPSTYIGLPCRVGNLDAAKFSCDPIKKADKNPPNLVRRISSYQNPEFNNFKKKINTLISEFRNGDYFSKSLFSDNINELFKHEKVKHDFRKKFYKKLYKLNQKNTLTYKEYCLFYKIYKRDINILIKKNNQFSRAISRE